MGGLLPFDGQKKVRGRATGVNGFGTAGKGWGVRGGGTGGGFARRWLVRGPGRGPARGRGISEALRRARAVPSEWTSSPSLSPTARPAFANPLVHRPPPPPGPGP